MFFWRCREEESTKNTRVSVRARRVWTFELMGNDGDAQANRKRKLAALKARRAESNVANAALKDADPADNSR